MGETESALVAARLETSRKELLDLTFRNPLLNYRCLRARGVEVIDSSPSDVYRALVAEEKKARFAPAVEAAATDDDGIDDMHDSGSAMQGELVLTSPPVPAPDAAESAPAARRGSLVLPTPHAPADLNKRLLNTYYTARTFIEEQGINTLYLALGMLKWCEDGNPQTERSSPLILVPVELERDAAADRFYLKYRDEDAGENVSLVTLMQNEHGIAFPEFPPGDDLNVDEYLGAVRQLISLRATWRVDASAVALAFFSFAKFQMYKDLDAKTWPDEQQPCDHPMLQAVLGSGFHEAPSEIALDVDVDDVVRVLDTHTVKDADSSQSIAILDVLGGRNMVIQGPPGTGKSQTITNIIAESLAAKKRILFVAEKLAALEVVKARLTEVELGDACLELHSNKSNKKLVLSDLKRTLDLGQPEDGARDDDAAVLQKAQDDLNAYAKVIDSPVGRSGLSVHRVFGEYIALGGSAPAFSLSGCSEWTPSEFEQRRALIAELAAQVGRMGAPNAHPFRGSRRVACSPPDIERVRTAAAAAKAKLQALRLSANALSTTLGISPPIGLASAQALADVLRRSIDAPAHDGVVFDSAEWVTQRAQIASLIETGEHLAALQGRCAALFRPDALDIETGALRERLADLGSRWWRIVSPRWHDAQKTFRSLCLDAKVKLPLNSQLSSLDDLAALQSVRREFAGRSEVGRRLFGMQWQEELSNWSALKVLCEWICDLDGDVRGGKIEKGVLDFLQANPQLQRYASDYQTLGMHLADFRSACDTAAASVDLDQPSRFVDGGPLASQPFDDLLALLDIWTDSSPRLTEIAQYNHICVDCRACGLDPLVAAIDRADIAPDEIEREFRQATIWSLLQTAYHEHPVLGHFAGSSHDQLVRTFRDFDSRHLRNNRAKVARVHWDNLPAIRDEGQLRVLRREFEKRSRHLPLRKLLVEAGRAIQAIKPVFMMSPLSVAAYVAPGAVDFDIVIFDEASQVRPVDAIGALLRGRQAVVVGDSKQLPPTAFFDTITSSEDVNEESVTADLESILGTFIAQGAPERMLRWHYRSRHESLIAVSNQEFYDNELVIFPSPDATREQFGLHLHYLSGNIYDRGRSSTNRAEAQTVAQHVMDHAQRQVRLPEQQWQSLGVAAFSMTQMQAVLDAVEALRRQNPSCESFFAPSRPEPFFVKNLENVQGDERDIIYISVGYGKDSEGKMSMNFGPLNGEGGARRLNVLITRAKLRCEVFTSLAADDIVLTNGSSHGLRALKVFLHYAQTGSLPISTPTGRDPDSPFEREVIRLLRSMNYDVVPQVGCAGYFIDIAVRDPDKPGRYLIGIECDGRTYHSAKSARDRDRLREQVLRAQGWKLHRIWSTDWVRQPTEEAQRVHEAIEQARSESRPALEAVFEESAPDAGASTVQTAADGVGSVVRVEAKRVAKAAPAYLRASLIPAPYLAMANYPAHLLDGLVSAVIAAEGPVHAAEVARRIADSAAIGRVSQKLRDAVDTAIARAGRNGSIEMRGPFCWPVPAPIVSVRNRAGLDPASKKLEYVAPEEIRAAITHCLDDAYGMTEDELPKAVIRALFGFERLSRENREAILDQLHILDKLGAVAMNGDQIHMAEPR